MRIALAIVVAAGCATRPTPATRALPTPAKATEWLATCEDTARRDELEERRRDEDPRWKVGDHFNQPKGLPVRETRYERLLEDCRRVRGLPVVEPASQPMVVEKKARACFEVSVGRRGAGGSIAGRVTDKNGGSGIAGVTVVATGPAIRGTMAEITDDSGAYLITKLPPGVYVVTYYVSERKIERRGVEVDGKHGATLEQRIDLGEVQAGETITIGGIVDKDYIRRLPNVPCE